ncbi:MAG: thioredoxin family protein [Syntrophales bacterium]|nr:thioredoxin family protein [Syntrophales bacterium]
MYDRLLIAAAFFAFGITVFKLIRCITAKKAGRNLPALHGRRQGTSLIIYFTSPNCGVCKAAQTPALNSLQESFGQKLQVMTINVDEDMEAARLWKVMTLPTTFVFNASGRLVHHNIGFADAAKLFRQLNKGKLSARKSTGIYVSREKTI